MHVLWRALAATYFLAAAPHLGIFGEHGYSSRQHNEDGADVPLLGGEVQRRLSEHIAVEAVRPRLGDGTRNRQREGRGGVLDRRDVQGRGGGILLLCMAVVV